jgi:hypothetical protein
MARSILAAIALLALCAPGAQALEFTLFFGQASGGELGEFGYQVRGAGDLNGDGYPDIVVGAPFDSTLGLDSGRAFVWFGGPGMTGDPDLILDDTNGGDYFGFAVAGVGDLDGDGFDDLAVGAPGFDFSGLDRGRVYVYRGGMNMDDTPDNNFEGEFGGDRFGWSIAGAGDMNRDGRNDMIVGAPYNSTGGNNVGRAYLFVGASSIMTMGPDPDVTWSGVAGGAPTNTTNFASFAPDGQPINGPGFGYSVANLSDFRGDGRAAVAVGSPGQSGAQGRAYLFIASSTTGALPPTTPRATFTNNIANEEFGWSVASGGDVNGDGRADLLIGAPGTNGSTGSVRIYYGSSSASGTVSSPSLERSRGVTGDRFGHAISGAGDIEGGANHWLVGAPGDDSAGLNAGRVYLYSGISSNPTVIGPRGGGTAPVAEDQWGFSLDGLFGDLDGDDKNEFIVGAPTGNDPSNAVRGVLALVSSGNRIVAAPDVRLAGTRRIGTDVEISFDTVIHGNIDQVSLLNEGRAVAHWGAGIEPTLRGLRAVVPVSDLRTETVVLQWSVDGVPGSQEFNLPSMVSRVATLHPAVPNPFNPRTTLSVELPEATRVRLRVFDLRGRVVKELLDENLPAGVTPVDFDGTDSRGRRLSSGSYVAVLEAGEYRATRRLTLVQ